MITCSCGKVMDKIPSWLEGVKVEFICNNCPNRQIKSITEVQLMPVATENPAEAVIEGDADDEAEDD